MLGQVPWAKLSPSGPVFLLLALCAVLTTQDICSSPDPHARLPHALNTGTALAVAAVVLVLLAAGSWFAIRKGACRGRCPRPPHGAGSDEDSSADPSQYYANVDEMGRVKLSQSICSQHPLDAKS
ncbi:uncharacterized protein LOC118159445 isoform X3 [Oxyura jamaicensis]|uniref:uncharacterized protein LOC118159445 isoform X3 n=1 Tax=Oxyura jamaicensis TaxID=8884 RepID=UPI0015A63C9D|nr:uncharacterized protein LOC118159445 isoform X3 [Oxyura jamaicensis]